MFERLRRGGELGRAAWAVLASSPRLALFPVISAVVVLALSAAIGTPVLAVLGDDKTTVSSGQLAAMVVGAVFWYFACAFVIVFCNAALIGCAFRHFDGQRPTVLSGFADAGTRLPQILRWSAVASTAGLAFTVLEGLSDKINLLGQIVEGVADGGWSLVTYFVLPVVVSEGLGPVSAVRRSAAVLRRTWKETAGGAVRIGLRLAPFALPLFGLIALLAVGIGGQSMRVVLGVVIAVYAAGFVVVVAALGSILRAALYRYATTGAPAGPLTTDLLQSAFAAR